MFCKIISNFSGPKLPMMVSESSMITSPTGRGVILIGGSKQLDPKITVMREVGILRVKSKDLFSDSLIELTGNSISTLKWTILEQKLLYPRSSHVALSIPDNLIN